MHGCILAPCCFESNANILCKTPEKICKAKGLNNILLDLCDITEKEYPGDVFPAAKHRSPAHLLFSPSVIEGQPIRRKLA